VDTVYQYASTLFDHGTSLRAATKMATLRDSRKHPYSRCDGDYVGECYTYYVRASKIYFQRNYTQFLIYLQ
jgi:hypothetical protein